MAHGCQTIVVPSDFSHADTIAFNHALRIALATKSKLVLAHTADSEECDDCLSQVRKSLALWKLLTEHDPPEAIGKLGISLERFELQRSAPLRSLLRFLDQNPANLIVLAAHHRGALARLLQESIAEELPGWARVPTLFIPSRTLGFVDRWTGALHLSRVLVPIDHSPEPDSALGTIGTFVRAMNPYNPVIWLMHVGKIPPLTKHQHAVGLWNGEPVRAIITAANEQRIDLIAMPTAGRHGFLDALRGSTTERVLRHVSCPVLAVPA
jgi:nucleotide-binding universal stress UspA family protein